MVSECAHVEIFPPRIRRPVLYGAVCCFGISALMTQLTLMRELVSIFSGNELTFGIVLGNWMLLTGAGSALSRTSRRLPSPVAGLLMLQILIAVLPIAAVFLVRTLHNVVFIRGAEVGVTETVASCFLLLAPYCLATGYLLPLACRVAASAEDPSSIGEVYFFDNLGSVLGGIALSFVLIRLFNHFEILYFPAFLNLVFAALAAWSAGRRRWSGLVIALTVGLLGLIATVNLDRLSYRLEYAGQKVVFHGTSPYGMLVVTESVGEYNFLENGVVLFSTRNVEQVEETVHYALAQRPDARRVLLISGGISGTAREILKYPRVEVDYVELDPLVLQVARRFLPQRLSDPRIHVITTDGRQYVKQTDRRYDVVIVDAPGPSTSQLNRFYTREFFAEVHRALAPGGVFSFSRGGYEGTIDRDLGRLIAVAQRTLKEVFQRVLILPGGRNIFLASDGALTPAVAERLERAGVPTRLVNRHYLRGMLTADRLADIRRVLSADAPLNEDFNPILYYYHLRYWISQFEVRLGALEGGLALLMVFYIVRLRPVAFVIFAGGFAASALEVVLLIAFQILYGCVYHQVGLILTMFMLGLGIGSFAMNHWLKAWGRNHLTGLALAMTLFAAGAPFVLLGLGRIETGSGSWIAWPAIPLLTLLLAVLVGMEFPLAGKVSFQNVTSTASRLYTADYMGAALGALLVSTLLIPLLGITLVCLLTAGLNLLSAAIMIVFRKG
jgi:spermidine synthase